MSYCKLRRNMTSSGCASSDKPSNASLASENNKKFDAMMAERARQDALLFGVESTHPASAHPASAHQQNNPTPKK